MGCVGNARAGTGGWGMIGRCAFCLNKKGEVGHTSSCFLPARFPDGMDIFLRTSHCAGCLASAQKNGSKPKLRALHSVYAAKTACFVSRCRTPWTHRFLRYEPGNRHGFPNPKIVWRRFNFNITDTKSQSCWAKILLENISFVCGGRATREPNRLFSAK